jgi:hypothetical protein
MTEPTPPTIPPRGRPTDSGDERRPTSSRAQTGAAVAWEAGEAPAAKQRPSKGRSATSANGRTGAVPTDVPHAPGPHGASVPVPAEPGAEHPSGPISSGSAPNSPARREAEPAVEPETRMTSTSSAPLGDDEPPSPLMVAVDTASTWVRRAATTTGAAIGSLTRPKPEEPAMSSPAAAPSTGQRPATGSVPRVTQSRPSSGRIPVVAGPRRVRLAISRLDPWSVMKLSFLLSVAAGIILVIATAAVWFTLDGLHVFTKINDLVVQVTGKESGVNILQYVAFKKIVSGATLVAVIDVFLLTALATIGAFLYNIVAALVGGLHVTMTDE